MDESIKGRIEHFSLQKFYWWSVRKRHEVNNEKWKTNSKSEDINDHKTSVNKTEPCQFTKQNHITCEKEHAINERSKQVQKMKNMKEGKLRLPIAHFTKQNSKHAKITCL